MSRRDRDDDERQDRVSLGELVRIVRRIESIVERIDGATDSIEKRVTMIELIHPNRQHDVAVVRSSYGTFAKFLATVGTVVFSVTAGIVTAIANWKAGH